MSDRPFSKPLHDRYMALAHKDYFGMREVASEAIETIETLELRLKRADSSAWPSESIFDRNKRRADIPTPRTDHAVVLGNTLPEGHPAAGYREEWVTAIFARELERDLAEANGEPHRAGTTVPIGPGHVAPPSSGPALVWKRIDGVTVWLCVACRQEWSQATKLDAPPACCVACGSSGPIVAQMVPNVHREGDAR